MEDVKISITFYYYEPFIPPRCRKTRYIKKTEEVKFKVRSVTSQEAPVAFRLSDYHHVSENTTEIRFFKGKLWEQVNNRRMFCGGDLNQVGFEDLPRLLYPGLTYDEKERSRDYCISRYKEEIRRFLVIDGKIWRRVGEPRYVVNTFGLGHNHGGTGLFVETFYNENIAKRNYFSALDGDKAVAYANEVAQRRGDTEDVGTFEKMIEVIMPDCVKLKPMKQHGNGNPFINKINAITERSSSSAEAGLLLLASL